MELDNSLHFYPKANRFNSEFFITEHWKRELQNVAFEEKNIKVNVDREDTF